MRFVEKRGLDAAEELIEERRREGRRRDAERVRRHAADVRRIQDRADERMRNMALDGSFSYRSHAERARMEDLRQDPKEASDKAAKQMKAMSQEYSRERAAATERVAKRPDLSARTTEELRRWEAARQDPAEAREAAGHRRREAARRHGEERRAMSARLAARPRGTFWSPEQRRAIEARRQDPDEARQAMEVRMKDTARRHDQEAKAMLARVAEIPPMNLRPKAEWEAIEEARQDIDEAMADMKKRSREEALAYEQQKSAMMERVKASPRKTFWTRGEREQIEALRQDPDEARQKAERHMREIAQSYAQQKKEMSERVASYPRTTVHAPEVRARMKAAADLRAAQAARA